MRLYDRENPRVRHKLASGEWADRDSCDVTAPVGSPFSDGWDISALNGQAKERLGFPTRKPLAVLERTITASSNPGDIVLDPFCGCGVVFPFRNFTIDHLVPRAKGGTDHLDNLQLLVRGVQQCQGAGPAGGVESTPAGRRG